MIYEWFGLNPFCRPEMVEFLSGFEDCGEEYEAKKWYLIFGIVMLFSTVFIYFLQYHIIDKSRFSGFKWWWFFAVSAFIFNFIFSFLYLYNFSINAEDSEFNCLSEGVMILSNADYLLFALNNAIWSFFVFVIISSSPIPRRFSRNCYNTKFYRS
jgi:hypothetical protein